MCEAGTLCAAIAVQCEPDVPLLTCAAAQITTDSAAAIDCTLAAIVDASVGEVAWRIDGLPDYHMEVKLALVGDGTAFRYGRITQEPDFEVLPAVHLQLEPVAYFEDCLSKPTPAERFVCLREGQQVEPFKDCAVGFFGKH